MIKELIKICDIMIGENRIFDIRKDNVQYSLGQTNGYFVKREELKKIKEKLIKKIKK